MPAIPHTHVIFDVDEKMNRLLNAHIHTIRSVSRTSTQLCRGYAKKAADPSKYIKKKKYIRVRDLFKTEEDLQKHLAQKMLDAHPENYGREGYVLSLPFYKDERAAIMIKARSEYPEWLFESSIYKTWSLPELEEYRIQVGGTLPEDLQKIYNRLARAAKMKLYNKYGKRWVAYYGFVLSGDITI